MLVAAATGIVEPPAAIAVCRLRVRRRAAPLGLAFAAGAMLYVVVDELIPESRIRGNEQIASTAVLGGFALMMFLDNAFG